MSLNLFVTQSKEYLPPLLQIYRHCFGVGESAHYIDEEALFSYLDNLLEDGFAVLLEEDENVKGALLAVPLAFDGECPEKLKLKLDMDRSLYIAELMVHESLRGRGWGKRLLDECERFASGGEWSDLVIRVRIENAPAIHLYRKSGFQDVDSILQKKQRADGSAPIYMHKIYLHKKLKSQNEKTFRTERFDSPYGELE